MSNLPYTLEQDLFDRKTRALGYIQQGAATDPISLSRLLGIANTWPSLKPGVALSLSQSGFDRSSPEVKSAAQLAMKADLNQNQWHVHLADYSGDTQKQVDAKHPDPNFVIQTLLPQWKKLQQKGGENYTDKDVELQHQLNAGLSYAALHYNDKQLTDIAKQFGIDRQGQQSLKQLASAARSQHDIGGAGADVGKIPYVGPVLDVAKTGIREAAAVGNMPLQGLQGAIRNVASGGNPLFGASGQTPGYQTDVGQQFQNLITNHDTSLGNGYLPSPESAPAKQALAAQQAAAPTIAGHAFTLGRYGASQVFEPDTNAFNVLSGIVDAGVAIKGDPTAAIMGAAGDARQAAKTFSPDVNALSTATGLYDASDRARLDQFVKGNYLAGDGFVNDWNAIVAKAGTDGNTSRMMRVINNAKLGTPTYPITTVHGQPLIEDLAAAAKAGDAEAARTAIAKATQVQSPLDPPGVTYKLRQGADSRLFASMPQGSIADAYDKNANWKILDDVMRGAKVPMEARDAALHKYITDPSPMAGISAVSDTVEQNLIHQFGVDPATAKMRATFFRDAHTSARMYDIDQATGVERVRPGIGIAGEGFPVPAPSLSTEGLNSPIPIPNQRELRRSASDFNYITATKPWKVTQTALTYPATLWKPLQVLTARMGVRIFGETQLNMMGRGLQTAFNHPLNWISMLMGTNYDKRWATLLEKTPLDASYILGPDGRGVIDDSTNLLMNSASFIHDPWTVATKGWMGVPPSDARAGEGLAEQLGRMHGDPIMRGVAQAENPAAAKEWFWSGDGKDLRLARAPMTANEDSHNMQKLAAGDLTGYDPIGDIANSRAAADNYLDKVMYPKFTDMTGGHPDLVAAVQTGKLKGRTIYTMPNGNPDLAIVDQRAADYAKELLGQGIGPQRSIPVRELRKVSANVGSEAAVYAKQAIDWTFHRLVDSPDRLLNRNPAYAQLQWKNAEELAPYLREDHLAQLVDTAEQAKLPAAQIKRIRNIRPDQTSSERLTIDQLSHLSKANALDDMKYIVHDLTSRSQFFDMARMLTPFGDAFRLIAQRMVHLAAEEPQTIRRFQQGIQELQSPGSSTINKVLGDPVAPGQGFFHTDPSTGEEMFTFPGSTMIDQSLLGVPIPLQGQVSGLNMLGEGYPGLGGPALTIPAKWFLPDTPTGNQIRGIIFPYGTTPSQGVGADIGESFVPAWFNKVSRGLTQTIDQKTFNSMTLQVMQTLMSQGGYDKANPDDMARLANDAKQDARWLYVIRGTAQFVSPGSPQPDYHVEDKTGHLIDTQTLATKYRDQQTKKGPDQALQWLITNFGTKNIFVTQSASAPTSYAAPSTKEAQTWVDQHSGVVTKYPLTYGLFAPAGKTFSIDAYNEQFTKGERRTLSPAEQVAQSENRLGFFAYDKKRQQILDSNQGGNLTQNQTAWLRDYRAYLKDQFPGFDTYLASPYDSRKRRDSAIQELQTAAKDSTITSTDAGAGLKDYLGLRDKAIASAKDKGLASPFQAKSARGIREWLRQGAQWVVDNHPEFRSMYEQIFNHEMTFDPKATG